MVDVKGLKDFACNGPLDMLSYTYSSMQSLLKYTLLSTNLIDDKEKDKIHEELEGRTLESVVSKHLEGYLKYSFENIVESQNSFAQ